MILSETETIVSTITSLFDKKEEYHLNMFMAGRQSSLAEPGKPSVPNTIGTILLNMAAEHNYVTVDLLCSAIIQTGDRTLTRHRNVAIKSLLENGDFMLRRVKGGGAKEVLFPTEELLQRMFSRVNCRSDKESDWASKRSSNKDIRRRRSESKRRQLIKEQRMLLAIANDLGYSLS